MSESTAITLYCWVRGEKPDCVFPVEIKKAESVAALKEAIKETRTPSFDLVPADILVLWKVFIPIDENVTDEDLKETLEKLNLDDEQALAPVQALSEVFPEPINPDSEHLHIVVKVPPVTLKLNCLVLGQSRFRIFPVNIASRENVGALKVAIKGQKTPSFDRVPARNLVIWKVSILADKHLEENVEKLNLDGVQPLLPAEDLLKVFPESPVEGHLHVVVKSPFSQRSPHNPIFPRQTHFTSLADSTTQHFKYVSQPMEQRLLFFGKLSDGRDICIKIADSYSYEAHSLCASMGAAPELLGFEMIDGGLYMVVMDLISKDYIEFRKLWSTPIVYDKLREVLSRLHQAGFVHGDIRDTNIMVPKSGEPRFMLIDFDWAGKIGEVRYPMYVYRGMDLWRPEEACDGNLITADHDIQMLEHLFAL